jgi:hypothetical protein
LSEFSSACCAQRYPQRLVYQREEVASIKKSY